jgi:hypothetical protein
MKDKFRFVIIPGEGRLRLKTRQIKVNGREDLNVAKVRFKDFWYIFDIDTEQVLSQAHIWGNALKQLKELEK